MKRTISRIKAMVRLYQFDLLKSSDNLDTFDELLKEVNEDFESDDQESNEEMMVYDCPFSDIIYLGVIDNLSKIDRNIAINLDNYPLDRLSFVDRALLRIGTYELMYTYTPAPVIINEIINLSKQYSEVDKFYTSKFNNGVLDKLIISLIITGAGVYVYINS